MNILTDAQVLIAFFNFITGIANVVWSLQLRNMKNDGDTIKEMKSAIKDKEELLTELEKDKDRWKTQYHSLLKKFNHLEGQLKVYNGMNGKGIEAQPQSKPITT